MQHDYDYIIIGSGFGGSVSALRLAEKGYKVLVLEKGKWYSEKDFPRSNWHLRRWLWLPGIRFFGIMKMTILRHVNILSGTGVGGGSLVYANTLPRPKPAFFNSGSWKGLADWEAELAPFYSTAERMLGAAPNPRLGAADLALKQLADEMGKTEHFAPANVSVFFGASGKTVSDPFFAGKGPDRSGCTFCGGCMTGCRYNAKNSLDKNYLHLAQQLGVRIMAENKAFDVRPIGAADGSQGYEVHFKSSTAFVFSKKNKRSTKGVIFAGGVMGTVPLLLRLRRKSLPLLSPVLGNDVRTNNESLIFVTNTDGSLDLSEGIAIGSILHTDADSHLEPVRYAKGSGFWRLLALPNVEGKNLPARLANTLRQYLSKPLAMLRATFVADWAKSTSVLLFMQHLDSTLRLSLNWFGAVGSSVEKGKAPSAFIPRAGQLARHYARIVKGQPMSFFLETLAGIPSTAHILGGAVMGKDAGSGVIDKDNQVHGYQNMLVCDGSMISANPGVNPSLTITAISERAMSKVAPKG
ncbi:MAG TPA: GMC family oxidoreductase [Bacteroidetes bacterium]|nr:GMC family oxidoreductase [Bacteroidota bacterium]